MFEEMWQDLRLAWRGLRRAKAFTAAAVLSLATGIAGISLTFALVNGVLLRPLPVRDQDRLLVAWTELRALRLVGTGAVTGLATAVAVTRVVQDLLFKVAPLDPVAIVTAMLLLVAVSAIASYLPVRRAARVDPIALLKTV